MKVHSRGSQESEVCHVEILSTKTFLARTTFEFLSQFQQDNPTPLLVKPFLKLTLKNDIRTKIPNILNIIQILR